MTVAASDLKDFAQVLADAMAIAAARPRPSIEHSPDEYERTGEGTHRATKRGYALGDLVEEGAIVPAGIAVSENWMEALDKRAARLTRAVEEAQDESPKDVDLTQVGLPGLRAMAAERGINPKGLSEKDLITAIKAEREPTI